MSEIVVMLSQHNFEKTGYSYGVDWWSLGVTMFKLLTGFRPFTDDNFNTFVDMCTTMNELVRDHCDSTEYAKLFQEIPFPPYISPVCSDLISRLLDVDERTRLGCGANGVGDIKAHPFFKGIDWSLLEQKHVDPPFKPDHSKIIRGNDDVTPFPDFETMMRQYNKSAWLDHIPTEKDQKYFENWDFISPNTIKIEAGLAHTMDQYDKNFKVRQLMGDIGDKGGKIKHSNTGTSSHSSSKHTTQNSVTAMNGVSGMTEDEVIKQAAKLSL